LRPPTGQKAAAGAKALRLATLMPACGGVRRAPGGPDLGDNWSILAGNLRFSGENLLILAVSWQSDNKCDFLCVCFHYAFLRTLSTLSGVISGR
jgi:hypothetical protein